MHLRGVCDSEHYSPKSGHIQDRLCQRRAARRIRLGGLGTKARVVAHLHESSL